MHQRCTRILSVRENSHAVSTASKALLRQRRCGVHGLEGSPWTKTTWAISRSSREV
ncbi:unnamed protein product [Spirodela intermedia]|uniref:Uncharacterized protein n=1 Tax=Spirodela intermedia TaxID=51605 RepID=A0A7I8KXQ7_SPIIN|nr:unnamed protein product [Spirodela intermedia]